MKRIMDGLGSITPNCLNNHLAFSWGMNSFWKSFERTMLIISGTIATSYVVRNLAICGRNSAIDLAPFASWDVTLSVTRVTIKMEIEGFIVDLARTEVEVLRKLQVVMFFGVLPPFIRPVVGQIEILGHSIPKISANAAKKKTPNLVGSQIFSSRFCATTKF